MSCSRESRVLGAGLRLGGQGTLSLWRRWAGDRTRAFCALDKGSIAGLYTRPKVDVLGRLSTMQSFEEAHYLCFLFWCQGWNVGKGSATELHPQPRLQSSSQCSSQERDPVSSLLCRVRRVWTLRLGEP